MAGTNTETLAPINDLNLLDYSYRQEPIISPSTPPPTLLNGNQLRLISLFSENGANVPGSVNIDRLEDSKTNTLYVVSRGSANLQNAQSDLQLANDPVTQQAISYVERTRQTSTYAGSTIESQSLLRCNLLRYYGDSAFN